MIISQIAELTGLTPRAIRHYEDLGLVSLTRDTFNERWFDLKARRRLLFIAKLRRAGLPLAAIKHVIDIGRHDPPAQRTAVKTMLRRRKDELAALRAFVDGMLCNIDELFDGGHEPSVEDGAQSLRLARTRKKCGAPANPCEAARG